MGFTRGLMQVGAWSLSLFDEMPFSTYSKIKYFGHVVITEGRVNPALFSDATLLEMAAYVGMVRQKTPDTTGALIGGPGLEAWLGDEDGHGFIYEFARDYRGLGYGLSDLLDSTGDSLTTLGTTDPDADPPGILRTDTGGPLPIISGDVSTSPEIWEGFAFLSTPRQMLDTILPSFEFEYRVNANGTVDIGPESDLFVTTPTAYLTRKAVSGSAQRKVTVADLQYTESSESYVQRAIATANYGSGLLGTIPIATASITPTSTDLVELADIQGSTYRWAGLFDAPGTADSTSAAAGFANRKLAEATIERQFSINLADYDLKGSFQPGDYVYIWDPKRGLVDTANAATLSGVPINPIKLRVKSITSNFTEGMGAYYRDASGAYTDLTPYVIPEPAGASVEVGNQKRPLLAQVEAKEYADKIDPAIFSVPFSYTGNLSASTGTSRWTCPYRRARIHSMYAAIGSTSNGDVIIDIHKTTSTGSDSIFASSTNRITIASGDNASTYHTRAGRKKRLLSRGDFLTVDVDQIGTGGFPGADLVVTLRMEVG